MNESAPWLGERLFLHVLEISLYGSGLLLLVLAIDLVWRDKVPLRFRQVLGILAAVRLLVPFTFTSPAGVFGALSVEAPIEVSNFRPSVAFPPTDRSTTGTSILTTATAEPVSTAPPPPRGIGVVDVVTGVWLAGLFGLVALTSMRYLRLRRGLRDGRSPDERLERLIEACAWEMGLRRPPSAMLTRFVSTPAVTGLFNAQLLLPENFEAELSEDEQRMVLLHELAHVRHRDLWVNWLIALVRAVHWFNPLVWLAFRRMRLQQELLCDRAVIARLGEPAAAEYGAALVRVMERFVTPRAVPGLLPVVTNQNQLKERIVMLMQKQSPGRKLAAAGVVIAAICAVIVFAKATDKSGTDPEEQTPGNSSADLNSLATSLRTAEAELNRLEDVVDELRANLESGGGSDLPLSLRSSDTIRESLGTDYARLARQVGLAAAVLDQVGGGKRFDDVASILMLHYPNEFPELKIRELLAERSRLEQAMATLLVRYGPSYPTVRATQAQLDENQKQFAKAIPSFVRGLQAKRAADETALRQVEAMLSEVSKVNELRNAPESLRE